MMFQGSKNVSGVSKFMEIAVSVVVKEEIISSIEILQRFYMSLVHFLRN